MVLGLVPVALLLGSSHALQARAERRRNPVQEDAGDSDCVPKRRGRRDGVGGLSKAYGREAGVRALDDFTLEFPAGQCTVLLGPSGCGKTHRAALDRGPDHARRRPHRDRRRRRLRCRDAAPNVPPEKRRLGMVFQSYALWPHLTSRREHRLSRWPPAPCRRPRSAARPTRCSNGSAWAAWASRYVHELSGGQQQRVSLGRAMVGKPRAILFDEPLSNLDARLRERMRMELLALRQRAPFTSIYVTHDQLEAMTLGDRVVVMRAGKIEQVGSPEDVYRRPRTRFAADFVGIPNLLEGTVRAIDSTGIAVDTIIGTLHTRGWRSDWTVGARCTVAVRPDPHQLRARERTGAPAGRIVRSVFQGNSSIHIVNMEGVDMTVESFREERHAPGTNVRVTPATGAVFALLDD